MNILLVAATTFEIQPLLTYFKFDETTLQVEDHKIDVLITGVGIAPTAFSLGQHLARQTYDLAINLGIAGSFDRNLALGDVVLVDRDIFADWGAEDGESFLPIDVLGFGTSEQSSTGPLLSITQNLQRVTGITVNKVHGYELSIANVVTRLNPQIESMEGAAFFYACTKTATPSLQIRSISNYVERRNREAWNIDLAVKNINVFAINLLNNLPSMLY